jgi:hypothetical protein
MLDVYTMVSVPSRHCFNWTIAENLRLEREYDLLQLDVNAIAKMHGRSVHAIVHQLQTEGIIGRFSDARGYEMSTSSNNSADQVEDNDSDSEYEFEQECDDDDDDDDDAVDEDYEAVIQMNARLQRRVAQLETTISLMKKAKSAPKRQPLRKQFM